VTPFDYPAEPDRRRHGPAGYADPESFRPWLRDEFIFRCAYCLRRERWELGRTEFEIDHLVPVARASDLARAYDNLLYTCDVCNSVKGIRALPDPGLALLAGEVTVKADGRMVGRSREARRVIRVLGLDDAEFTSYWGRWIWIAALAREHDPALDRQLMGFPDDLPNLAALRPPGGNARPEGIEESYFRRRERGELPAMY
jgi:hypothetical protein